jgi:hypothetical protein
MIDKYTKVVLTVIAVALVALVIERALEPAIAQNGMCGVQAPCKVVNYNKNESGDLVPCFSSDRTCFAVFSRTH